MNLVKIKKWFGVEVFDKDAVLDDSLFAYRPNEACYIDSFLSRNHSFLVTVEIQGLSVGELINRAGNQFNINTKLFIVLLEKYHGLITAKDPVALEIIDKALDIGYSEKNGLIPAMSGLDKQLYWYGSNLRRAYDRFQTLNKPVIKCTDGEVRPKNGFTYALYTCDPFIGTKTICKREILKDSDGEVIEDTPIIKKRLFRQPLITKRFKQETKLFKQTPFGVFKTWKVWKSI
jgi:hypothetical protein